MKNAYLLGIIVLFLLVSVSGKVSAISESVGLDDYSVDFEWDEDDVKPGDIFRIEVTVTNEAGETREDVTIDIDLSSSFDNVGDTSREIGTLDDEESKSVTFRIEVEDDTEEGDYDIDFEVSDNVDSESDEISVEVKSDRPELVIGDIASLPTIISPDTEDIRLELTVENIGDGDAEFIRGRLLLPQGFTPSNSYSDIVNLGLISEGDNKVATFFIDSEEFVDSGMHVGRLQLEYENEGDSYTETLAFDLPVKGRPQFVIEQVSTSPSRLVPGEESTLRLVVLNRGEEEGEETSIRVFENSDQPFEFDEKTNFIGDLMPGETGTGSIGFSVENGAIEKEYLVRVQVRTINSGNVLVEEMSVPVRVYEAEGGNGMSLVFGLTGVLFIVLIAMVLVFRRNGGKKRK